MAEARHEPPQNPERGDAARAELVKLDRTLLREFIEVNLLGAAIIAVFFLVFQRAASPLLSRSIVQWLVLAMAVGFALALLVSRKLSKPLLRWLRRGDVGRPAPQRLQIAVVVQPALQSALAMTYWTLAGVAFGLIEGITAEAFGRRHFVAAFAGCFIAGLAVSAITYLRIEHTWRPWIPQFFKDEDPIGLPLPPADRLRTRLRWMYVLGTVVPLITMAMVTSYPVEPTIAVGELAGLAWFLALSGIFVAGVFAVNVHHSITQPIHRIEDAMERVEEGDFAVRVPIDRIDELGRLQKGFNEMVAGLQARERVEDLFGRQVGGQVAEAALQSAREGTAAVSLGGEVRHATALFVDLAAFSTLAEFAQPQQLAQLLNVVFEVIVEAVEGTGGLVNKFQGDAVLAVFGAPREDEAHAVHALEAAAVIAGRLESMRLDFGIGISAGDVFAGNIGSATRFEYTVVGDPVNEASRLQELTRDLGRRVLLNGAAAEAARASGGRAAAALVPVGLFVLRGKTHETEVFSLSPQMWRGASVDEAEDADLAAADAPLEEATG